MRRDKAERGEQTSRDAAIRCESDRDRAPAPSHLDGEGCELFLVDGSLIDGVRDRQVDHFTSKRDESNPESENS